MASREHDAGYRHGILRSLEDLVCRAQRQVIRSEKTAARTPMASEADRLDHKRDLDLAKLLAFALCARQHDRDALADFLDVIAENPWRTLRLVEITHPAGGRA
jgi:hypothetical protein